MKGQYRRHLATEWLATKADVIVCPNCRCEKEKVYLTGVLVNSGGEITKVDHRGTETEIGRPQGKGLIVKLRFWCEQCGGLFIVSIKYRKRKTTIWNSWLEQLDSGDKIKPIWDGAIKLLPNEKMLKCTECGSKGLMEHALRCENGHADLRTEVKRLRSADKRIAQRVSEYWGIPYDKIIEIVKEEFVLQPVRGRGCSVCAGIIGNFTCCACGRVVKPDDTINERGFSTRLDNRIKELEHYKTDHNVLLIRIKELHVLRSRIIDAERNRSR